MIAPTPARIGFAVARMFCIAAALSAVSPLRASFAGSVAVAAGADEDYVRGRLTGGGSVPRAEGYVVAEGRHFGGNLSDPSAEKVQFGDLVRALAPGLAEQQFFPAADKRDARLLIVVHWGTTEVAEDPTGGALDFSQFQSDMEAYNGQLRTAGPIADPSRMNSDLDVVDGKSTVTSNSAGYNARLLGFCPGAQEAGVLQRLGAPSGMTEMDRRIREALEDPRYFVILMAYDIGRPASGGKAAKPKLLWSVHFSTRAAGDGFSGGRCGDDRRRVRVLWPQCRRAGP